MSASSKKKLRKEQNAAAMTEKQLQEQKEAKKLRLYTGLFGLAIVVMILVVIASRVISSGFIPRSTTALTVGGTEISAAELNHYYVDSVNNFMNGEYGQYAALLGLDTTKPLDEQFYNEEENQTWADYFIENAAASAQNMYAIYNAAKADGKTLSAESQATIDSTVNNFAMYAPLSGFASTDAYIAAMYGEGCNEETFRHYAEVQMLASEYATAYSESLTYGEDAIRAEDKANTDNYSSFTYNYCYLANSSFYEGGTEDEKGNKTYSDAEKEAGRAAAEAAANSLLTATTVEELDAAIAALPFNAESTTAKSVRNENYAYNSILSVAREWVTGERAEGDIVVIPNETTTHDHEDGEECTGENDTKVINGYYVVRFENENKNETNLVNVRHILVSYTGGTTDSTGATTYSDEEKAAARKAAQEILATFNAGEKTEEAFAALATEKTTDTGSKENGGLYENVYPGQTVQAFNDWCFDAARTPGETAIVETEYGCHVMYFVGDSDVTYRDYQIRSALKSSAVSEWYTGIVDAATVTEGDTRYLSLDLVLSR